MYSVSSFISTDVASYISQNISRIGSIEDMCFLDSHSENAQSIEIVQNSNYGTSLLNPCAVAFIPNDKLITTKLNFNAQPFVPKFILYNDNYVISVILVIIFIITILILKILHIPENQNADILAPKERCCFFISDISYVSKNGE